MSVPETKLGDIFLEQDNVACRALWRPADGSPDTLLCAINLRVYSDHSFIKDAFVRLAADVAVNLNQPKGLSRAVQHGPVTTSADTVLDRRQFPCWTCASEQAVDARYWLGTFGDEDLARQLSPAGMPFFCCKVI
jgi:hypothetical protein